MSVLALGNALQKVLAAKFHEVGGLLVPETNLMTDETEINIMEVYSETAADIPCVVYDIVSTESLTPDDPVTGCFKSTVLIYAVSYHSLRTILMADIIMQLFTLPDSLTDRRGCWFRDISDDCLINKFTKYVNRFSANPRRNDYRTDTYSDVVEIEVIWCPCNCEGIICQEDLDDDCPIDPGDDTYDIEDCCD